MKLSARSRYAARILLELARQKNDGPISATVLSQQTGVSVQFVEQLLKPLKQKGFTTSQRGAAGGHMLARPASDISLGDIVKLMEGSTNVAVCCDESMTNCPRVETCATRKAWLIVSNTLKSVLNNISLEDLLLYDRSLDGSTGPCTKEQKEQELGKPKKSAGRTSTPSSKRLVHALTRGRKKG